MTTESDRLLNIAKAQKAIIWCILATFVAFFLPIVFLVVLPFQLYYIFKLAQALEYDSPILWCIGMFVPYVSLILLLVLSQKATTRLKDSGCKIGLMGANLDEVREKSVLVELGSVDNG